MRFQFAFCRFGWGKLERTQSVTAPRKFFASDPLRKRYKNKSIFHLFSAVFSAALPYEARLSCFLAHSSFAASRRATTKAIYKVDYRVAPFCYHPNFTAISIAHRIHFTDIRTIILSDAGHRSCACIGTLWLFFLFLSEPSHDWRIICESIIPLFIVWRRERSADVGFVSDWKASYFTSAKLMI